MDVDQLKALCAGLPGAWEDNPWEHEHPVFKVGPDERGKIFAFCATTSVGVKAGRSRDEADAWLQRHPGSARAMAYIGRSGWNDLDFDIPDDELVEAVLDSYRMVVAGLPRKHRPDDWDLL